MKKLFLKVSIAIFMAVWVLGAILIIQGCSKDEDFVEVYIWVGPEKIISHNGAGEEIELMDVRIIDEKEENICSLLLYNIVGFDYEEGYTYILYVRVEPNPLAEYFHEAPRYVYALIKMILKEKVN